MRVISREVNPEVEGQYNDETAAEDKDGHENALTHNQLLHLAVQLISERAAYRVDQKGKHDTACTTCDQEKAQSCVLVGLALAQDIPLKEHDKDHTNDDYSRYQVKRKSAYL